MYFWELSILRTPKKEIFIYAEAQLLDIMRGSDGRSLRSYFGIALLPASLSRRVCRERVSKPMIILRHTSRYPVTVSSVSSTQQSLQRGRCYNVGTKWFPQARPHRLSSEDREMGNIFWIVGSEFLQLCRQWMTVLQKIALHRVSRRSCARRFFSSEQDSKAQACTLYSSVKSRADCRTVWKRPAPLRRRAQEMHLVCRSRHVV
jgi:hypothetical protein